MDMLSIFILLFLVMDPLGNVPLFIATLEQVPDQRRTRVLLRELVIALAALFGFLLVGERAMTLLGIRQEAIAIGGALILFIISLKMLFPGTRPDYEEEFGGEPLVVPLAIPFLAGPSALATLLLLAGNEDADLGVLSAALLLAWLASALILLSSNFLGRWLGRRGLVAMERLMGMVLVAIAVQMFLDGLRVFLAAV